MLRALRQYLQGKEGNRFWKKAAKLEMQAFEHLVGILATSGTEIKHTDPRVAIAFGLRMSVSTLWELVVNHQDTELWKGLLPKDDQALGRELTRAFLSWAG